MAITGVAVGSAGLLIALAIVHGFKLTIEEKILGFGNHITVHTYTTQPIFRADTLSTFIADIPGVDAAQPVIYGQGMVQAGQLVEGSFVKGVDRDGDLSDVRSYIISGTYDLTQQETGRPGLVMGARLARSLNASPGNTITVYTVRGGLSANNMPEIVQFTLTGIYETGIDKFDDTLVLVDRTFAYRLFNIEPPVADQIDIRVSNLAAIEQVQQVLNETLPLPFYTENIYQAYSSLFAWINLQEQTIPFVIAVMVIIAAFNLIGTVLMMVLERTKDIGILKTMGAGDKQIRKVFIMEGLMVAVTGLVIGILLSLLFYYLQTTYEIIPLSQENYYMDTAPVHPKLSDFFLVTGVTLFLCWLASWLPARIAAATDPLRTIQFGR